MKPQHLTLEDFADFPNPIPFASDSHMQKRLTMLYSIETNTGTYVVEYLKHSGGKQQDTFTDFKEALERYNRCYEVKI